MTHVIALDPGFGSYKVSLSRNPVVLQTAVSRPRAVGRATIGLKSAAHGVPVIEFDGARFAVGTGSWHRGAPLTSMDYAAITSQERLALLYAAVAQAGPELLANHELDDALLVIGLPVPLLQDDAQASNLLESLRGLKRAHAFSLDGESYQFGISRIKYLAQPVGAYVDWLYDDALQVRAGGAQSEVAVIDLGMNTLDLYALKNAQVMETFVGGAEVGVRRLFDLMSSNGHDLVEQDARLRNGTLRPEPAILDAWLGEVLAALKRVVVSWKRFDVVIATGGGALLLRDRLERALAVKGAPVFIPDDPVTSNVRGLWKYGQRSR